MNLTLEDLKVSIELNHIDAFIEMLPDCKASALYNCKELFYEIPCASSSLEVKVVDDQNMVWINCVCGKANEKFALELAIEDVISVADEVYVQTTDEYCYVEIGFEKKAEFCWDYDEALYECW